MAELSRPRNETIEPKRRTRLTGAKVGLASFVIALAAYAAWIPAVADNSHPVLATVAAVVFWGALIVLLSVVVRMLGRLMKALRRRGSG